MVTKAIDIDEYMEKREREEGRRTNVVYTDIWRTWIKAMEHFMVFFCNYFLSRKLCQTETSCKWLRH